MNLTWAHRLQLHLTLKVCDLWILKFYVEETDFNKEKAQEKVQFMPLYRMDYGGIVIYDIEADIPGQPFQDPYDRM